MVVMKMATKWSLGKRGEGRQDILCINLDVNTDMKTRVLVEDGGKSHNFYLKRANVKMCWVVQSSTYISSSHRCQDASGGSSSTPCPDQRDSFLLSHAT